jgi:periplasmic protein TonB
MKTGELMFEDSLVESTGRIRTHSKWFAIASFALQAVVLIVLILIPYLYPASLPPQALSTLLIAPPPPSVPAPLQHAVAVRAANPVQLAGLIAPTVIPRRIVEGDSASPVPPGMDTGLGDQGTGDVRGAMVLLGSAPPPSSVKPQPKASGPVRVSAGVAAGRLLAPIQAVYPAIARAAHIQGTVTIEAVISKQGSIEQARVVSGSPMLAQAALAALTRARYQPYKLNNEPVEVETTINIEFVLDN